MFRVSFAAVVLLIAGAAPTQAGILFNRGCNGGQAQATGCVGRQAGCHGFFGGGRLFNGRLFDGHILHRRGAGCCGGQAAATVAPKMAVYQPMPRSGSECPGGVCPTVNAVFGAGIQAGGDALDEVNQIRARRGLRPFQRDGLLTQAAQRCAEHRAARRLAGHVPEGLGDFQFVPTGGYATAAGCAVSEGEFRACCVFDDYAIAGAAKVVGPDGQVFCQIFVR